MNVKKLNITPETRRKVLKNVALAVGIGAAACVQAEEVDTSAILAAIQFGAITAGIVAIGAVLMAPQVAWKGVKMLVGAVRSM